MINKKNSFKDVYFYYANQVRFLRDELASLTGKEIIDDILPKLKLSDEDKIYTALAKISVPIANSYLQVKDDLSKSNKYSWAGTAHEIREIVSNLLRLLAPDKEIEKESWYKIEKDAKGPTQKQKVKYILQKQNAGSKQTEVTELVIHMEDLISNMVRATYSRASDAAHRLKGRKEAIRLFKYFEAFAYDLLDLD